jgi:phenylalanyl-tRNA synthetase beta chain
VTAADDGWQIVPPTRRFDIAIEEDLVEEIARIHGYDKRARHAAGGGTRLVAPTETRVEEGTVRRHWPRAITSKR